MYFIIFCFLNFAQFLGRSYTEANKALASVNCL